MTTITPSTDRPVGTRIVGVGHYRPANVVTNADLIARGVDTNDEWIQSRVGIAERQGRDDLVQERAIPLPERFEFRQRRIVGFHRLEPGFRLFAGLGRVR